MIEREVAVQIMAHMDANCPMETLQSAYQPGHSTETALTQITNDILPAFDFKKLVFIVLLKLSAAFDTADHGI